MGRAFSSDFQDLLANDRVESHSTLDLVYADGTTEKHVSTTSLTGVNGHTYTPYLKSVGEIKQSLSSVTDRVNVKLFNNDRVFGLDVANILRYFTLAKASVGQYWSADNDVFDYYTEKFFGNVVSVEVDEREVRLDIIDSLVAKGTVISARNFTSDEWKYPYIKVAVAPSGSDGFTGGQTGADGSTGIISGGDGGESCFVAGTPIPMADGSSKAIEEVKAGNWVKSFYFDPGTQKDIVVAGEVAEVFRHLTDNIFTVNLQNGECVKATGNHPFYIGNKKYLPLEDLPFAGTHLFTLDGKFLAPSNIRSIQWTCEFFEPVPVYNFHVRTYENYFANGIAVHNKRAADEIEYNYYQ